MNILAQPLLVVQNPVDPNAKRKIPLLQSEPFGLNGRNRLGFAVEVPAGMTCSSCAIEFTTDNSVLNPVWAQSAAVPALAPGAGPARLETAFDIAAGGVARLVLAISGAPTVPGTFVRAYFTETCI